MFLKLVFKLKSGREKRSFNQLQFQRLNTRSKIGLVSQGYFLCVCVVGGGGTF